MDDDDIFCKYCRLDSDMQAEEFVAVELIPQAICSNVGLRFVG